MATAEIAAHSAFDEAFRTGVPAALPAQAARRRDSEPILGAAPSTPVALGGAVIRDGVSMAHGWVIVDGGTITDVVANKPTGVAAIETGGVILPGLLDLHGHPEFNVFAPWEPPKTFINRGQWRGDPLYQRLVRDPWDSLTKGGASQSAKKAMTRYAEVRAVVGGVTAIQGASKDYPNKAEALVRNVDLRIFGTQVARSTVDVDRLMPDEVERIAKGIGAGTVKAHYVHLAEGQKSNQASVNEFLRFANSKLFGAATVMIHGTALRREHFDLLAQAGGKLVWSPQSNLRLYDETTDVKAALAAGLPIAIGADWMPSGSPSLLHELKIAQRCLAAQGCDVDARQLVEMVTSGAADIAGLGDRLGRLEPGRPADLLVLQRRFTDPYENVAAAYPWWVELVMIGGDVIFARTDWAAQMAALDEFEVVTAWGRQMALDTRFGTPAANAAGGPPRRLAEIRSRLISRYPAVGPVFA